MPCILCFLLYFIKYYNYVGNIRSRPVRAFDREVPHLHPKVTARAVHFRDGCPHVTCRTEPLPVVHPGDSVESPDGVYKSGVRDGPDSAPTVAHGGDQGPLVCFRVVALSGVETFLSVETTSDENLACGKRIHIDTINRLSSVLLSPILGPNYLISYLGLHTI